VFFSSRNPEELAPLVEQGGALARSGLPADAASFGTVVLVATPFDALPQVGADFSPLMQGKVVICCSNPSRNDPSPLSQDALERGSGVVSAALFPGVRLTRAFNAINFRFVESEAHRAGELVGIPVAGDDEDAVRVTSQLVVDAGFDPVFVGPLSTAGSFDPGTPVFVSNMTAAELRVALGLRYGR
jgi:predicted dinucleotide-binding enzyme